MVVPQPLEASSRTQNPYETPVIVRTIKTRRKGETRNADRILIVNLYGRLHLRDVDVNGRMIH
jgi:hypothetical protein